MKKILGIPITLFVLGILVLGTATAVLVKYFSNTITHTVDVNSPLQMIGDTDLSLSIYGGENILYGVTTKNLANVSVDSYPVTMITGPGIWQGTELSEVTLQDPSGTYNVLSLGLLYIIKDDGTLILFSNAATLNTTTLKLYVDKTGTATLTKYTRGIGFEEQNNITITTNPAIMPGTYTIKSCQLYDWSGECV
jgi:hypothetical protein